jgi:hypothetical protein
VLPLYTAAHCVIPVYIGGKLRPPSDLRKFDGKSKFCARSQNSYPPANPYFTPEPGNAMVKKEDLAYVKKIEKVSDENLSQYKNNS